MSITDPRDDTRLPGFAKGPLFGGVPHTRVVIFFPAAIAEGAFLQNGCLVENIRDDNTGNTFGLAEWKGETFVNGERWSVRYWWFMDNHFEARASAQVQVINHDRSKTNSYFSALYNPDISLPFSLPVNWDNSGGDYGSTCAKFDVPEWADPTDRWPLLTVFPPV